MKQHFAMPVSPHSLLSPLSGERDEVSLREFHANDRSFHSAKQKGTLHLFRLSCHRYIVQRLQNVSSIVLRSVSYPVKISRESC